MLILKGLGDNCENDFKQCNSMQKTYSGGKRNEKESALFGTGNNNGSFHDRRMWKHNYREGDIRISTG